MKRNNKNEIYTKTDIVWSIAFGWTLAIILMGIVLICRENFYKNKINKIKRYSLTRNGARIYKETKKFERITFINKTK